MFSETVNQVVFRSGRRDRLPSIVSFVNEIINDLHAKASWARDGREERLDPVFATGADMTVYTWQEPKFFRVMQAVRFNGSCWSTGVKPSAGQGRHSSFHYKVQSEYAFKHSCGIMWIDLYYYLRSPYLDCYPKAKEPARFDRATEEWTYLLPDDTYAATLGSTAQDEAAQALVANWILKRWQHVVIAGTLAKLYADLRDDRQPIQWAQYQDGIANMKRYEIFGEL